MDKPPIFRAPGFAEALEQAQHSGKWLIVDATAEWCQPCKQMDRTTWRDSAVAAWIDRHALALQIDVGEEEALSETLAIRAMPTVIAFRDGKEQDRFTGYRPPAGLLAWFAGLERGETALDQLRRSITDPERDMRGRLHLAEALLQAGRYDEATEDYVWLWRNLARVEPSMGGVRVSFMAQDIDNLVREHAAARARFTEIRDEAGAEAAASSADSAREARFDWIVLNELLQDEARTIAWFDAAKGDPAQAPVLEHAAHRLIPALRARRRWADIGGLYRHPLAQLAQAHALSQVPEGMAPEMRDELVQISVQMFRDEAALLFATLRAADRSEEAAAVEREALRLDPSDEMQSALAKALHECVPLS